MTASLDEMRAEFTRDLRDSIAGWVHRGYIKSHIVEDLLDSAIDLIAADFSHEGAARTLLYAAHLRLETRRLDREDGEAA